MSSHMNEPSDDAKTRLQQLELENLRLKAELEARKAVQGSGKTVRKLVTESSTRLMVGKGLKKSFRQLLEELPEGKVSRDTLAEIMTHTIWRITRIGTFAIVMAIAPLLILIVQTTILNRQNDKLDTQNGLPPKPTARPADKPRRGQPPQLFGLFYEQYHGQARP